MSGTRHIHQRMSKRGINSEMLNIVQQFGFWHCNDKCILNTKACEELLNEIDALRRSVVKVRDKGGVVLVHKNGFDITAYSLDSFNRGLGRG